jgi:hypothetical protein
MRSEGLDKLKKSFTSSGPEPETFRLVAQCLSATTHLDICLKCTRKRKDKGRHIPSLGTRIELAALRNLRTIRSHRVTISL